MKSAVWKYTLNPGVTAIEIPRNAFVVCVREQGDDVCIWMHVHPDEIKVLREFCAIPTDAVFNDMHMEYLGSAHFKQGAEVFHVYERMKQPDHTQPPFSKFVQL